LAENPDIKKQSSEIQKQRYELYESERQSNINRCILKRQEIISNTKKIVPSQKKLNVEENDAEDNEEDASFDDLYKRYKARKTENNSYYLRKNNSTKRQKFVPKKKILITENSYIMNNSSG